MLADSAWPCVDYGSHFRRLFYYSRSYDLSAFYFIPHCSTPLPITVTWLRYELGASHFYISHLRQRADTTCWP